jgi:aminoglycoside phosphotransferase (APT) family kinase protein
MDAQELGSGPLADARPLTGGTQNLLLAFRRGEDRYVLRRPPLHPGGNADEAMRREALVLGQLAGTDVPHPALIASCPKPDVLGAAFYLMAPIDGFSPIGDLPGIAREAEYQHGIGLEMARGLAALSRIDVKTGKLGSLGRLDGYLERQAPRWLGMLHGYSRYEGWPGPGHLPHVEEVAAWLEANRPSGFRPGLVHGDYHLGNVMFDRRRCRLAAIVDWELVTVGEPLVDLGWLLATWPDPATGDGLPRLRTSPCDSFAAPAEIVACYGALTGRDLTHLPWYVVLACFKLGIILEGTHARSCAGKADPREGAALHESAVWLLRRAAATSRGER